jgi:hypothetical protein
MADLLCSFSVSHRLVCPQATLRSDGNHAKSSPSQKLALAGIPLLTNFLILTMAGITTDHPNDPKNELKHKTPAVYIGRRNRGIDAAANQALHAVQLALCCWFDAVTTPTWQA